MGRKFKVKPIEPLILEFADGITKEVALTNAALMILFEEFGDFTKLFEEEYCKPIELASKILYAGMKVMDTSVTLEEARNILIGGGLELQITMFDMLNENFGEISEEDLKKNLMPMVNKYLIERK